MYAFNNDKSKAEIKSTDGVLVYRSPIHSQDNKYYDTWRNTLSDIRTITNRLDLDESISNYDWIEIFVTAISAEYPVSTGEYTWHEYFNVQSIFNQMTYRGTSIFELGWRWESSITDLFAPPIVTLGKSSGEGFIEISFSVPGGDTKTATVSVVGYGQHE